MEINEAYEIKLDEFAGGALTELFNKAMVKIKENLADPNTEVKGKRKIVITSEFKTDDYRELVTTSTQIKITLAPEMAVNTVMRIGKDLKSGQIIASEIGKQMTGQQVLIIDPETGELISQEDYKKKYDDNSNDKENNHGLKVVK